MGQIPKTRLNNKQQTTVLRVLRDELTSCTLSRVQVLRLCKVFGIETYNTNTEKLSLQLADLILAEYLPDYTSSK